ncbi:MAG: DUF1361 domain-containing protein [Patescibacteria group bacterium]
MQRLYISARVKLGLALGVSSLASTGLYIAGAWSNHNSAFNYMLWNLFLAWLALLAALWLERTVHRTHWSSWYGLFVTALWLAILPNTFYMVSDFVHIQEVGRVDLLYDVVMFSSFIFNGVMLGFLSLFIVHWELVKRIPQAMAAAFVGIILLLCSFAVYIGRELRWNTWDILANPSSLLFDVSDRVLNLREHPQVFTTTASLFVLLATVYTVLWYSVKASPGRRN